MELEDSITLHEHYVMHELLILQILLHEVDGHGDALVPMDEMMTFVLQQSYIVGIVSYNLMSENHVMMGMIYDEMGVIRYVPLLNLDTHVLHHETLVKISMNVHWVQIIVIAMQHVQTHYETFLVHV